MEQNVNEHQEVCVIHQLMKLGLMQQSLFKEGGFAWQSSGTRTTHAPSGTAVSPPNDAKPIAPATQASGFANTVMLRTL